MTMATGYKKEKVRLPPKRGEVKIKIFWYFVLIVARVASKAGRGHGIKKKKVTADGSDQPSPPHPKSPNVTDKYVA
ncbi:hypothetical protein PVL29_010117 [Vitis rotundifolia]|uniref:Uncharacterized protein n=1 Tax=Vitis rotundifolia TaxID=103349 RepID=A0AA39DUC8_VITRO|nr:hypothetical protein PVL29_010117 [Vitis rotundifolia]